MPSSAQARAMRTAISPRFAISRDEKGGAGAIGTLETSVPKRTPEAGPRCSASLVAGQRRDGLSVERPAALAAAEHAADHLDLAAAALPMHHPIVDHVPDEATAHQAGEIRLKPAIPASERRRLRLRSNGSRFHSNPPHVTPGCPDPRHDVLHANRRFGRSTTL